jgi:hypothetical protein
MRVAVFVSSTSSKWVIRLPMIRFTPEELVEYDQTEYDGGHKTGVKDGKRGGLMNLRLEEGDHEHGRENESLHRAAMNPANHSPYAV